MITINSAINAHAFPTALRLIAEGHLVGPDQVAHLLRHTEANNTPETQNLRKELFEARDALLNAPKLALMEYITIPNKKDHPLAKPMHRMESAFLALLSSLQN